MKIKKLIFPLLLISSLTALSVEAKITGAFFQLHGGLINKPRSYWENELDLMQQAGMDTVIIQFSATDSSRFFGGSELLAYRFAGPFAAGKHEIVIEKGPIVIYEIETKVPFSYELAGAEPIMLFGDDGEKLRDGNHTLDSAVVWSADASGPIIISLELEEPTESISILAGALSPNQPLPEAKQVTLADGPATATSQDDYTYLLEEAEKRNMHVWLGLKLSDNWWSGKLDLQKDCADNLALANELQQHYGSYASFAGWYIPHELYPSGALPKSYMNFFRDLTIGLQKTGKPVSIAPYFGANMSPRDHGRYWERFFKEVPLDVLMLQDGIGCHRLPVDQIPVYYKEVYAICKKYNVQFWSDLEVFDQLPGEGFSADTADFSRVKQQVLTQTPTVDKIVIFDWPHYMSPTKGAKAKELYDSYVKWLQEPSL